LNASLKPVPVDRMADAPYRIDAVLFDFDGTLTRPGALDFSVIKRAIGCPDGIPCWSSWPASKTEKQRRTWPGNLDRFELDGAVASRPNHGTEQLVATIRKAGLPVGILTRNSRESVVKAMENFSTLSMADIDVIVTREDPVRIKPSGEGVLLAAEKMGVDPAHVLMVGDFEFDVQAGRHAGALTAYLSNGRPVPDDIGSRFVVDTCRNWKRSSQTGCRSRPASCPIPFWNPPGSRYRIEDPSVIVGPSVGEDTAAVDIAGEAVLVLKTDPITFATESIGRYAVSVNANDMATAGAAARWMLATLLLPCGFSRSQVRGIFADLHDACTDAGITLCGGHTEITDAVRRPVVAGMMAGTIARRDLIRKQQMAPGDRVLVTKGVAVEGTAIIAAEFGTC
jgi:hydrogenase expression/formation protein HypE